MSSSRSIEAEGCPFMREEEHTPKKQVGTPLVARKAGVSPEQPGATPSILGFAAANRKFFDVNATPGLGESTENVEPCHYSSYLAIHELHMLQEGQAWSKPGGRGMMHHEELTFIIVHQVFELWFKLVFADLSKAREFLSDLMHATPFVQHQRISLCISYLRRADVIFQHAMGAFNVMETMHPADFIEFRDFLVPASGFQSVAFRSLEQLLGVQNASRAKVNGAEVFSYLRKSEQEQLKDEAKVPSLNQWVVNLFSKVNVPSNFIQTFLDTHEKVLRIQQFDIAKAPKGDAKAESLVKKGVETMRAMVEDPVAWSEGLMLETEEEAAQYKQAVIGALFVMSYRNEPRFMLLASLADEFIAVEEGMVLWRSRHAAMAERMIGRRSGTGGTSSGVGYLDVTRRYRIFHCLWLVRKMFVRSSALPNLDTYAGQDDDAAIFLDESGTPAKGGVATPKRNASFNDVTKQ